MPKALFIDTSKCMGCRACQVACKQWHDLPAEKTRFGGTYENPPRLSASTWRRVKFIEAGQNGRTRWLFMSDACKHCTEASCLAVCPTKALFRNKFGAVDLNQEVCNGCRYCVAACPFGVISFNKETGRVNKCILCPDRLEAGLKPACATACPPGAITFGEREQLMAQAKRRLEELKRQGETKAQIYGEKELGGLNAFYLLLDEPSVYGLPEKPRFAVADVFSGYFFSVVASFAVGIAAIVAFRERREREGQP